jgi:choline dehydrogenase-like flavoprotein
MEPYYARAHPYVDIGSYGYGLDAPTGLREEHLFLQGDQNFRTKIMRLSPPTHLGPKYRDHLVASDRIDLWLWTALTDLALREDGTIDRLVAGNVGGPSHSFRARIVVLACGAVENARQLMLANARSATSFGDAGGLLGRCYMDHPNGGAGTITFARPLVDKAYWTPDLRHATDGVGFNFLLAPRRELLEAEGLPNVQYYLNPRLSQRGREARSALQSLKTMAKYAQGRDPGEDGYRLGREYCNFISKSDSFVSHTATELIWGTGVEEVWLREELEQLPDRENRVFLSDQRDATGLPVAGVNWSVSDEALAHLDRLTSLLGASIGAAGLGRMRLEDLSGRPFGGRATAWHQLGTTRMAESPTSGVCDTQGRVHGTRALYLAGGGLFPSGGAANPTLTILALSMRMADHLKAEVARL